MCTPIVAIQGSWLSLDSVHAVTWSPDGKRIASGSHDDPVQVWDTE